MTIYRIIYVFSADKSFKLGVFWKMDGFDWIFKEWRYIFNLQDFTEHRTKLNKQNK